MKIRTDLIDHLIALITAIILGFITATIIDTASNQAEVKSRIIKPRNTWGPEIPHCDKELWLRIKDRCK